MLLILHLHFIIAFVSSLFLFLCYCFPAIGWFIFLLKKFSIVSDVVDGVWQVIILVRIDCNSVLRW